MKNRTAPLLVIVLSLFLTVGYAKAQGEIEYTNSSQIGLILSQTLKDVKTGKATFSGANDLDAMKMAGFHVSKIIAVKMRDRIHLYLEVAGPKGEKFVDWNGKPITGNFFMQGPLDAWGNLIK